MSSTSNISPRYNGTLGIIFNAGYCAKIRTVEQARYGLYKTRLSYNVPWCLDNGVFNGRFDKDYWLARIDALKEYSNTCLFVVIPDAVGDCEETRKQFYFYRNMVTGFPVAFVSQDGIRHQASKIPWNDFDALFIGGSDNHKLGREGGWILSEAKKHNKWVHVGRVNSKSRILKFWQADSWDGTHIGYSPNTASREFHHVVNLVRLMKRQRQLF